MNPGLWFAFFIASVLIAISPGPGAVMSMSSGLRHGYRGALRAIAGLQAALWCQLAIVMAGLGALLATSATAFMACKIAGAAYLIWLGVQKWRATPEALTVEGAVPHRRLFRQGFLVNLTNPKAIVFMGALVPQFIDPAASALVQYLILASTMSAVDTVVMSAYALLAARFKPLLADPGALRVQNRLFGGMFVGAGVFLGGATRGV